MEINNINDFLSPMDNWKVVNPAPDMSGYISPIEMIVGQIQTEMDNQVMRAVQNVGVTVDKDELVKALNYDRQQYDKGYGDGYREAQKTLFNTHQVACMLADMFKDTCACNYSGNDTWLPQVCEVIESCPEPFGVACWEQFVWHYFKKQKGGADNG